MEDLNILIANQENSIFKFVFRSLDSPAIKLKVTQMFKNSTDLSQLFAGNPGVINIVSR